MALSHNSRRRWSLVILLVGLPLYIVVSVTLINLLERPNMMIDLIIYVGLGIVWILPFRSVFRGIGKSDPDDEKREEP